MVYFDSNKAFHSGVKLLSALGDYPLYIFLYHLLVINFLRIYGISSLNLWIQRIVCMSAMILIPISTKLLFDHFLRWIKKV